MQISSKIQGNSYQTNRLDPLESQHFHNARAQYVQKLKKAEPIPEGILTVPRINALHSKNKALISFLSSFHELIQADYNKMTDTEEMKKVVEKYLNHIENFAATLKDS